MTHTEPMTLPTPEEIAAMTAESFKDNKKGDKNQLIALDLAVCLLAIEDAVGATMEMISTYKESHGIHPQIADLLLQVLESINEYRTSLIPVAVDFLDSPQVQFAFDFCQHVVEAAFAEVASKRADDQLAKAVEEAAVKAPHEPVAEEKAAAQRLLSAIFADFQKGSTDGKG